MLLVLLADITKQFNEYTQKYYYQQDNACEAQSTKDYTKCMIIKSLYSIFMCSEIEIHSKKH